MQSKPLRKKKTLSSDEVELFQKFMVEEMKQWTIKDGQVTQSLDAFVPLSEIKSRFEAYKKRIYS